ncbi:MAG: hypothetical protein AAF557_12145 [Pseudomonadota bacterium]
MGEAGRKLTIRMPDNPRLRSAEVGKLHLDPGARVRVGSPIMTLISRSKEHMVRAPRPGRVVPLVAPGDEVSGGDPLYILNIDEKALAEAKRNEREVVAVEKAKWAEGLTPEVIEPVMRQRAERAARSYDFTGLVSSWAKPALAIALYVLACFALLPILNAFGRDASMGTLIAMCIGCILFGAVIFHLYAPDSGWWPRWTVRLVAASWIGISSMAIFYQQDTPDDITLADATAPLTRLFVAPEEVSIPVPDVAPKAPVILASGIAAGPTDEFPVPDYGLPKSVLGAPAAQPVPHGVRVLAWGRVVPTNASGDVLAFDQTDVIAEQMLASAAPADEVQAAQNSAALAATAEETEVPLSLATAPDLSVFRIPARDGGGTLIEVAHGSVAPEPTAPKADAVPARPTSADTQLQARTSEAIELLADGAVQPDTSVTAVSSWLGSAAVPVLLAETTHGPLQEPLPAVRAAKDAGLAQRDSREIRSTAGQAKMPALAAADNDGWLTNGALPVLQTDSVAGPDPDAGPSVAVAQDTAPVSGGAVRLALSEVDVAKPGLSTGSRESVKLAAVAVMQSDSLSEPVPDAAPPVVEAQDLTEAERLNARVAYAADAASKPSVDAITDGWLVDAEVPVMMSEAPRGPETDPAAPSAGEQDTIDDQLLALGVPAEHAATEPLVSANTPKVAPSEGVEIAILQSDRVATQEISDAAIQSALASSAPARAAVPSFLRPGLDPDVVLYAQRNAARDGWMFDQADRLATVKAETDLVLALEDDQNPASDAPAPAASPVEGDDAVSAPSADAGPVELAVLEGGLNTTVGFGAPVSALNGLGIVSLARPVSDALQVAAAPADVPVVPPWQPEPEPALAERVMLFLFYDDPRLKDVPGVGDDWQPLMSPDLAAAIETSKVEAVNEVLEVTNWCAAANDPGGKKEKFLPGGAYRTAVLGDRIRLLQVRVALPDDKLAQLEQEVPVFGDGPSGFFHNKMPLFGAKPGDAVMDKARAFMQASSNSEIDKNTPPGMDGGHYFTSAEDLALAMQSNGCAGAIFNDGEGPVNAIGRALESKIAG